MRCAFVGFDSAWNGKQGGICYALFEGDRLGDYCLPKPADFVHASSVIERFRADADYTLVAVDQPTMVPNATGMRPVERVAGSIKRGVQPANLHGAMFDRSAPIWSFLDGLDANEEPLKAQKAAADLHVIEVFPGLALPALLPPPGPELPHGLRYDPGKKSRFELAHWKQVTNSACMHAQKLDIEPFVGWSAKRADDTKPTKQDQDCLDALICLIVALKWHRGDPDTKVLGDWRGYMVTPLSAEAEKKATIKAKKHNVPINRGSWDVYEAALTYFDGRRYDTFEWLGHPNAALEGETPLERAKTLAGTQLVLDLIGRLEHGIPT